MNRKLLALAALLLPIAWGCNANPPAEPAQHAADDHDHDHGHAHGEHGHADHDHDHAGHDHASLPKSYDEAVSYIEAARNTIRDGLAAGEKSKADAKLHELGHVLEHMPEVLQSSDLSDEARAAAKKDLDELFELYGELDEQIHGDLEITYDKFGDKIDAAVERLHQHRDQN